MTKCVGLSICVCLSGYAQYPYHKAITIKTNILCYWSIAAELPIYSQLTTEFGYRSIDYTAFDIAALNNHYKQTLRWNVKYHFPMEDNTGKYYSPYVFTGINNIRHSVDYKHQSGHLNVDRVAIGVGVKRRRIDFWVACEKIVRTHKNEYTEYALNLGTSQWIPDIWVSGGIVINLINIKL